MKRVNKLILLVALCESACRLGFSQTVLPEIANEARIDQLLGQMTLEEKMNLIRGGIEDSSTYQGQAGFVPGVPRLHIPSLRMADGPPGILTRIPSQAETATMGVAATFSVKDAEDNGAVIGREARSLGIDVVLQPFINIDRDITFSRGYNTFGEDPFLTSVMGAAQIRGTQAQDVMAQAKHFIGYDSESYNTFIDAQTLHEVYAAPFEAAIKAGVSSVMCSYNHINGPFACGNSDTLKSLLKVEMGFKGFVTSDWGGVHNVDFINHGLDMEMPGVMQPDSPMALVMRTYFQTLPLPTGPRSKVTGEQLAGILGGRLPEEPDNGSLDMSAFPTDTDPRRMQDVLKDRTVSEATVTAAVRRVLYEIDRFGYLDGKQKHSITPQDVEANAEVIRRTAEHAAVLLKNDGALPLRQDDLDSLVLIGPTAGQVAAIGTFGERSPGLTERQVSPLDALRRTAPGAHIAFAVDDDMTGSPIQKETLSHDGRPGLLRTSESGHTSVDPEINFTNSNQRSLPANSSFKWSGTLTVPKSGSYWMYLQVLGARGVMIIDGKELGRTGALKGTVHGDVQHATQDNGLPTVDGLDNVRRSIELTKGRHSISVEVTPDTSNNPEQVRLSWMTPDQRISDHQRAIEAARHAHTAIVFLWTKGKPDFGLPGEQDKLIDEIAAVNPNTIVVLNVSQPVVLPWLNKVKAVLQMWWPGDEGGWATANVLLGEVDPAGRLPFTWAKRLEDYPATDPAHPERSSKGVNGKTTYSEGVNVGYRWFDSQNIAPLFPFGFGLSYTQFAYSNLVVRPAGDGGLDVEFQVKNVGKVDGDEIPQVYLEAPKDRPTGIQFAQKTLAAFERINLKPGENKTITLNIGKRSLQYWSENEHTWVLGGPRRVLVGASSRDLTLTSPVE
ncbi:beta-glucosidase [Acidicapsa ligni]|uniref:beta-glucosidase n=1 Tax=Acidicapsa ligni TaxID=542300 RepID=UPI0021DFCCCD|nr:glycoside hydrolase family 3 C-terminal domain-containing protein [Acidicapsa ligni]